MPTARLHRLVLAGLLAAVAVFHPPLTAADELKDDLVARRSRVMEHLDAGTMLILWSAPLRQYSRDIEYPYRQDSNLYYLTGITQAGTTLVLMPGNRKHREILFVRDRDPVYEHWEGPLLSHAEATARSGIAAVLPASQFDSFVAAMLNRTPHAPVETGEAAGFAQALTNGTARVALALEDQTLEDPPATPAIEFARRVPEDYPAVTVTNVAPLLTDLRLVKSPYEQRLLRRALEISSEAHRAAMKEGRPGAWEYEVKAAAEAVHTAQGGGMSFPAIVGSGPNATILHNPGADRQIRDGDLVLLDAAASYGYMAGDLTRTWPANGRFSPEQREIYELVLAAQDAGIAAAVPGTTLRDVHNRTVDVIRQGLLRLGLITDASGDQYRLWYTHGGVHYLGIDVHDVGDTNRPLEPGMAFVIEPGLYIRQAALDALPRTPENDALIARLQPAVTKYLDIGVRIEDAFLLEPSGLKRLTATVPRTVEEIEAFLQ